MKKNVLNLFLVASLAIASMLISIQNAKASHAMGAEITYKSLGNNTYKITWNFYFDCSSVFLMQSTYPFSLHSTSCAFDTTFTMSLDTALSGLEVTPICSFDTTTCSNPNSIYPGVKRYVYTDTLNLGSRYCSDFYISYAMNARNGNINTINSPGSTPLNVFAMLNDSVGNVNSPTFTSLPVPYICEGQMFCYNNGATNIDGDSMAYELMTPLSGGTNPSNFTQVSYISNFDSTQPITTTITPTFNPVNGQFCIDPTALDVGVMAFLVKEYRNNILIGEVERDVQINVINCSSSGNPALTGIDSTTFFSATIPPLIPYCFNIYSSDPNIALQDTIIFGNEISGATFTTSTGPRPYGTFCWTPPSYSVNPIPYCFTAKVKNNACPYNGIQTYTYCLTVGSQNCYANFNLYPDTALAHHYWAANDASGTPPLSYWWSWGDGHYDSVAYPNHTYDTAGFYTICLTISDTTGCVNTYCDSSYQIQRNANTMYWVNVINPLTTGINVTATKLQFATIYPNPNNGSFTLSYYLNNSQLPTLNSQLLITDIAGRQVYSKTITGIEGKENISLPLNNGIYFWELISGNDIPVKGKIVILK
jgi:hypothetical protein